jgi:hypothetical protein
MPAICGATDHNKPSTVARLRSHDHFLHTPIAAARTKPHGFEETAPNGGEFSNARLRVNCGLAENIGFLSLVLCHSLIFG